MNVQRIIILLALALLHATLLWPEHQVWADTHAIEQTQPMSATSVKFKSEKLFVAAIKQAVKTHDLSALFALVDGELAHGPRRADIANKQWSDLFSAEWDHQVLNSQSTEMGWRGFMLGSGNIWYTVIDQTWSIFSINADKSIAPSMPTIKPGWYINGQLIPATCFPLPEPWGENRNHERCMKTPRQTVWKRASNSIQTTSCDNDGYCDQMEYAVLAHLTPQQCKHHFPGHDHPCQDAKLVEVLLATGGTIGTIDLVAIYGLTGQDADHMQLLRLQTFAKKNDALNFIDKITAQPPTP